MFHMNQYRRLLIVTHYTTLVLYVPDMYIQPSLHKFGDNCPSILDNVMKSRSTFSFVSCTQICHIKCRSAYILNHIDHFDIFTTFTTKWKLDFRKYLRLSPHSTTRTSQFNTCLILTSIFHLGNNVSYHQRFLFQGAMSYNTIKNFKENNIVKLTKSLQDNLLILFFHEM